MRLVVFAIIPREQIFLDPIIALLIFGHVLVSLEIFV
jgi:hypothetical protein